MKRSPLRRGKPLKATTRLRRKAANPAKKIVAKKRKAKRERSPYERKRDDCWDRLSAIVRRIRPCCEICGKPASEVHHLIGRSCWFYRWDPKNLVALCYTHHNLVHDHNPLLFRDLLREAKPKQVAWWLEHYRDLHPGFWGQSKKERYVDMVWDWLDTIEQCTTLQELWDMPTWQEADDA